MYFSGPLDFEFRHNTLEPYVRPGGQPSVVAWTATYNAASFSTPKCHASSHVIDGIPFTIQFCFFPVLSLRFMTATVAAVGLAVVLHTSLYSILRNTMT